MTDAELQAIRQRVTQEYRGLYELQKIYLLDNVSAMLLDDVTVLLAEVERLRQEVGELNEAVEEAEMELSFYRKRYDQEDDA